MFKLKIKGKFFIKFCVVCFVCDWKKKTPENAKFHRKKLSSFDFDFCLTHFRKMLPFCTPWKYSDVSMEYKKGTLARNELSF